MSATTFAELWSELKSDAAASVAAVKAEAVALETQIVPVIESDIVLVLSQLKQLAIDTVLTAAKEALTGGEKLGLVVTTVLQAAEAEGKAIAVGDAQMLAQQAYYAVSTALTPPAP
jgi:hypothetical protein